MHPKNEQEEWVEAEVLHEGPLPTFGDATPPAMSATVKVQLFKMVLSMPAGLRKIAETIQNSPDPVAALSACHTIIDLVEEDAKKEVLRAKADLDKCDARLMKMELARALEGK